MSKTKFLGIPEGGKRAGWIEMEGGGSAGGGGGYVLEIDPTEHSMSSSGLLVESIDYTPLYQALCQGRNAVILLVREGGSKGPVPVYSVEAEVMDDGTWLRVNRGGIMPITFTNGSVS